MLVVAVLLVMGAPVSARQDLGTLLSRFLTGLYAGTVGIGVKLLAPVAVTDCSAPPYSFDGDANMGLGRGAADTLQQCVGGAAAVTTTAAAVTLGDTVSLAWSDVSLARLAADVVAPAAGDAFGLAAKAFIRTAPTISSGFGTSPSVVASNGTAAFTINVGTGGTASSGVIGLPAATTGWAVSCDNTSTNTATVFKTKQTAFTTTTATIGNYDAAGVAAAWVASNVLVCHAAAF